ncbi:hypothetical protein IFM89_015039 [Coptis chinensis]|uniref:Uncharacterized protein n=1 Tax=Coptis chinensis TaxID=261450 RepID=A0A835HMF3_9MAGN|nr:hypothetical protein IFM89_015039 [Coptis chinensis]
MWSGSYSRVKKHFLGEGGCGVKECTVNSQTLKIFKAEHENALKRKSTPLLQALVAIFIFVFRTQLEYIFSYSSIETPEKVDSLVFVHSNLRLLSTSGDEYKTGPSKSWDSLGQNLMLDGSSVLQDAKLYLDDEDLDPSSFEEGEAEQHI